MSTTDTAMTADLRSDLGVVLTDAVWTVEHVAVFYIRSVRQARRIVKLPGFPPPTPADKHRWSADRVRRHAEGEVVIEAQEIAAKAALADGQLRHTAKVGKMVRRDRAA